MERSGVSAGIWISADNATWYKLTDDNRAPIQQAPTRIEQVQRMANGAMRKFVIASKNVIDCSWTYIPAATQTISSLPKGNGSDMSLGTPFQPTTDGALGAGAMKAFYEKYLYQPVYVRLIEGTDIFSGTSYASSHVGSYTTPLTITTVTPGYSLTTVTTGSVTFTTSVAHGYTVGKIIDIAGIMPNGYNGSYVVTATDSSTKFAISNINIAPIVSGTNNTVQLVAGTRLYQAFMTDFKYTINKRFVLTDYVDMSIQFTEI